MIGQQLRGARHRWGGGAAEAVLAAARGQGDQPDPAGHRDRRRSAGRRPCIRGRDPQRREGDAGAGSGVLVRCGGMRSSRGSRRSACPRRSAERRRRPRSRRRSASMTVFDRYGRDYRMDGSAGVRVAGSGLLSGAGFVQPDPMAAVPTIDRRLGLVSDYTGPWQGYRSSTPAAFSFSARPRPDRVDRGQRRGGCGGGWNGLGAARHRLLADRHLDVMVGRRLVLWLLVGALAQQCCFAPHGVDRQPGRPWLRVHRHRGARQRAGSAPRRYVGWVGGADVDDDA